MSAPDSFAGRVTERDVFGKVRYMNANGLKRKFDMDLYAEKIERLKGEA